MIAINYLILLSRTRLNPDHVFGRIKTLYSLLETYPRVEPNHLNYESNINERIKIYNSIFDIICDDLSVEAQTALHNHWVEFITILNDEIAYLEKIYNKSNYGEKIMLASYLSALYKIYLESVTKIYQRPSNEYQNIYNKVKSEISRLMYDIKHPVWK